MTINYLCRRNVTFICMYLHTSFIGLKHNNELINKTNNRKWESPTCDVNSPKLWTFIRDIDDQLRYIFPLFDNHRGLNSRRGPRSFHLLLPLAPRDSWVHQKPDVAKMGKVRWWKLQIYVKRLVWYKQHMYWATFTSRPCVYLDGILLISIQLNVCDGLLL